MYDAYFDDSGTHPDSELAVAACYVSTERGWREFSKEWDRICCQEGFSAFHMVDFAAAHDPTKKPFADWPLEKRNRVYNALAKTINLNKRAGFAIAIPKEPFDRLVPTAPEPVRIKFGEHHYTYAVRTLMLMVAKWRKSSGIVLPVRYFFDTESDPALRKEIAIVWEHDEQREKWGFLFGIEKRDGYAFESRKVSKPLQAADILAWQMNWHMRNVIMRGKEDIPNTHERFKILRENQDLELGFMTEQQLQNNIQHEIDILSGKASSKYGNLTLS